MSSGESLHVYGALPQHRPSAHYRNRGCKHPDCVAAKNATRTEIRHRRYTQRDLVDGRLISPLLAPVNSDVAARHGTVYGRIDFGCECEACVQAQRSSRHRWPTPLWLAPGGSGLYATCGSLAREIAELLWPFAPLAAATIMSIALWRERVTSATVLSAANTPTGHRAMAAALLLAIGIMIATAATGNPDASQYRRLRRKDTAWVRNAPSYRAASAAPLFSSRVIAAGKPQPFIPLNVVLSALTARAAETRSPSSVSGR